MRDSERQRRGLGLFAGFVWLLLSCAAPGPEPVSSAFRYFEPPDPYDPWSVKISRWQTRQRAEPEPSLEPDATSGTLRSRFLEMRSTLLREQARTLAAWIQREATRAYARDVGGDHWPTLEEVLASDHEDCDGLELLVHQLLLELGLPAEQVYRAIVHRPSDGQYHMVTLWFEDPRDPWVIDPTGAMTRGMPRMSALPDWQPLKLFSATREYTVRPGAAHP
ncbi:MAG: hypothetical protein ACE5FG_06905 [Myxococcota bacterium]